MIAFGVVWGFSFLARLAPSGPAEPAATPQQLQAAAAAASAQAEKQAAADKRFSAGGVAQELVRKLARDPDSVKFDSVRVSENASVVCVEFRARNGFGAVDRDILVLVGTQVNSSPAAWNKHCTGSMYGVL